MPVMSLGHIDLLKKKPIIANEMTNLTEALKSDRFDLFSESARQVLINAHDEAIAMDHPAISHGHLLIGILRENGFNQPLIELGLSAKQLKEEMETLGRNGNETVMGTNLSPGAKSVLETAVLIAKSEQRFKVWAGDILRAIAGEAQGLNHLFVSGERATLDQLREHQVFAKMIELEKAQEERRTKSLGRTDEQLTSRGLLIELLEGQRGLEAKVDTILEKLTP